VGLWLSGDADADRVLTDSPIALLIGMVLDQQVLLERAFTSPRDLEQRLGRKLSAKHLATMDMDQLLEAFCTPPSLHRYPGSMAERTRKLCEVVVEEYGAKPETIWTTAKSGDELVKRLEALPGFGKPKARIFAALLGKQLKCQPTGWREASAPYGEPGTYLSVADITDQASRDKVREHKRAMKAKARAKATKA
jgi:uncharacterized HhH-GPD family protein